MSDIHTSRRKQWMESLDDLFDIARFDALELLDIEEDKLFLLKQRMKGREGCMLGVDVILNKKENRKIKRRKQEELRKRSSEELPTTSLGKNSIKEVF